MLLCERCGYVVDGLDMAGVCPECGFAIGESLPCEREGSAYQNRRGWKSLALTWAETLVRSKQMFTRLRIDEKGGKSLMWRGLIVAVSLPVALIGVAYVALVINQWEWIDITQRVIPFVFLGVGWFVVLCVGVAYTALAVPRVKYVAKKRGMRMNKSIAWTVVGQASMGLTLWPICLALWALVALPVMVYAEWSGDYDIYSAGWYEVLGVIFSVLLYVSFVLSFVEFEVLLSRGIRRLRYRNLLAESEDGLLDQEPSGLHPDQSTAFDIS